MVRKWQEWRKKWVKAEYKKERYLASKFLNHLKEVQKQEEKLRESIRNIIKRLVWEKEKTLGKKDLKMIV